jgi:hypothetical protein
MEQAFKASGMAARIRRLQPLGCSWAIHRGAGSESTYFVTAIPQWLRPLSSAVSHPARDTATPQPPRRTWAALEWRAPQNSLYLA